MPKQPIATREEKEKERLGKELKKLAPGLDFTARMQIALEMICSLKTVDRYLAGNVLRVATGVQMLRVAKGFTTAKV